MRLVYKRPLEQAHISILYTIKKMPRRVSRSLKVHLWLQAFGVDLHVVDVVAAIGAVAVAEDDRGVPRIVDRPAASPWTSASV